MRRHLSYTNVVATLALLFAMSGGALAAKHYLINSSNQINPKVLKKLKGKPGATGLTGAAGPQGKQGPAGKEGPPNPNAAFAASAAQATTADSATEAAAVGGMTVRKIYAKVPNGTGATTVLDLDGLRLIASCLGGAAALMAESTVEGADARFTFGTTTDKEDHTGGAATFNSGTTFDAMAGTARGTGELVDNRPDGIAITADYGVDDAPSVGGFNGCVFGGVAFAG